MVASVVFFDVGVALPAVNSVKLLPDPTPKSLPDRQFWRNIFTLTTLMSQLYMHENIFSVIEIIAYTIETREASSSLSTQLKSPINNF